MRLDAPAPSAVVFDVGEVLIDETRVWQVWADIAGVSPLTFAAVLGAAIVQGADHRAVFEVVAPNLDWLDFVDEHERRLGGLQACDLYPDVRACLDQLAVDGRVVAVAGNQPARRREQLAALALPAELLVTSDDLGAEKPAADFFGAVLARLGRDDAETVLYVGDRVDHDVLPAAAAGLRTCWLRRGPWGRLQDLPDDAEPELALEGLAELPLLLQQWHDAAAAAAP